MVEGRNIREKAADPWHCVCASDVEQRLAREHPAVWAKMQQPQANRQSAQEQADVAHVPTSLPPPVRIMPLKQTRHKAHQCRLHDERQMALFPPMAILSQVTTHQCPGRMTTLWPVVPLTY